MRFLLLSLCLLSLVFSVTASSNTMDNLVRRIRQQHNAAVEKHQEDTSVATQLVELANKVKSMESTHTTEQLQFLILSELQQMKQKQQETTKVGGYTCTCPQGHAAIGADCTFNGVKCVACNTGYHVSGLYCVADSYKQNTLSLDGTRACWPYGHICWDNDDPAQGCHQMCCSRNYHQAVTGEPNVGKDICSKEGPCWNAGHKCWDNDGQDSCRWNCCSGTWHHDDRLGYDVCDSVLPLRPAVSGWGGKLNGLMQFDLHFTDQPCWPAGRRCWNNGGRDSCWMNCCSRAYYHDNVKNADVCAPIPIDGKCYAQYTPCWNSFPVPRGEYYVEVRNGQKIPYPSCFNCCARVNRYTGAVKWPAWTEYYIGNGHHDATSVKTNWYDAFVAGFQNINPVQTLIDELVPTDGSSGISEICEEVGASIVKKGTKLAVDAVNTGLKLAFEENPITGAVGIAYAFLYGFFEKLFEPKWDLCD